MCLGSKNNTFEESILNELRESRPVAPTRAPPTNEENGDLHFCKYLAHLMKNMTEKKKLRLQSQFICQVIDGLENWNLRQIIKL